MPVSVSILILFRNKAANPPCCLASLAGADEIFFADPPRTGCAPGIAQEHGKPVRTDGAS